MSEHIDDVKRIAEDQARKNKQREEEDAKQTELFNAWKTVREWRGTVLDEWARLIADLGFVLDRQKLLSILDTPPAVDEAELATYWLAAEIVHLAMKNPADATRKLIEVSNLRKEPMGDGRIFSPEAMVEKWLRYKLRDHVIRTHISLEEIKLIGTTGTGTETVSAQPAIDPAVQRIDPPPTETTAPAEQRPDKAASRHETPPASTSGGKPAAENLDAALERQSIANEQQAHENLRSAIKDAANALELIPPSDPPRYYAPRAFRSLLREAWTLALVTRQWDDDPTPPLPEETDLPDRAATKKSLESLWNWSKRTLDRLIRPPADSSGAFSKLDEIKRAVSCLRGMFLRWTAFCSRFGEPIKALDDYGINTPSIVIGANGVAACLAQDTRIALAALYGHGTIPPALRACNLEDAIGKFPAWPTGAISAARNKAFLENLPVELDHLAKIYVELCDLETQLEFAPLSVLEAAPAGPLIPDAEALGDASGKPVPAHSTATPPAVPAVSKVGRLILAVLLKHVPTLKTIEEICNEVHGDSSERTVGPELKTLISDGLADRPRGQRKGATLTAKGKALAEKLSAKDGLSAMPKN